MSGVASLISTAATILGVWSAVSVLSVPVLVQCLRHQAGENLQCAAAMQREAWQESAAPARR